MIQSDPRLSKLAKIIALHDDHAAMEGQRAACRHVGGKLAAELGIEFSKAAIERAMWESRAAECAFSFDVDSFVDEWLRKRAAMSPEERRAADEESARRWEEIERRLAEWGKGEAERKAERQKQQAERDAEIAKAKEAERAWREQEEARKKAEREAERAEFERRKRVRDGTEAPQWDDLVDDQIEWLARIDDLDIVDADRAFISGVRAGVRNGCLGLFGDGLIRVNTLLRRAFETMEVAQ